MEGRRRDLRARARLCVDQPELMLLKARTDKVGGLSSQVITNQYFSVKRKIDELVCHCSKEGSSRESFPPRAPERSDLLLAALFRSAFRCIRRSPNQIDQYLLRVRVVDLIEVPPLVND